MNLQKILSLKSVDDCLAAYNAEDADTCLPILEILYDVLTSATITRHVIDFLKERVNDAQHVERLPVACFALHIYYCVQDREGKFGFSKRCMTKNEILRKLLNERLDFLHGQAAVHLLHYFDDALDMEDFFKFVTGYGIEQETKKQALDRISQACGYRPHVLDKAHAILVWMEWAQAHVHLFTERELAPLRRIKKKAHLMPLFMYFVGQYHACSLAMRFLIDKNVLWLILGNVSDRTREAAFEHLRTHRKRLIPFIHDCFEQGTVDLTTAELHVALFFLWPKLCELSDTSDFIVLLRLTSDFMSCHQGADVLHDMVLEKAKTLPRRIVTMLAKYYAATLIRNTHHTRLVGDAFFMLAAQQKSTRALNIPLKIFFSKLQRNACRQTGMNFLDFCCRLAHNKRRDWQKKGRQALLQGLACAKRPMDILAHLWQAEKTHGLIAYYGIRDAVITSVCSFQPDDKFLPEDIEMLLMWISENPDPAWANYFQDVLSCSGYFTSDAVEGVETVSLLLAKAALANGLSETLAAQWLDAFEQPILCSASYWLLSRLPAPAFENALAALTEMPVALNAKVLSDAFSTYVPHDPRKIIDFLLLSRRLMDYVVLVQGLVLNPLSLRYIDSLIDLHFSPPDANVPDIVHKILESTKQEILARAIIPFLRREGTAQTFLYLLQKHGANADAVAAILPVCLQKITIADYPLFSPLMRSLNVDEVALDEVADSLIALTQDIDLAFNLLASRNPNKFILGALLFCGWGSKSQFSFLVSPLTKMLQKGAVPIDLCGLSAKLKAYVHRTDYALELKDCNFWGMWLAYVPEDEKEEAYSALGQAIHHADNPDLIPYLQELVTNNPNPTLQTVAIKALRRLRR